MGHLKLRWIASCLAGALVALSGCTDRDDAVDSQPTPGGDGTGAVSDGAAASSGSAANSGSEANSGQGGTPSSNESSSGAAGEPSAEPTVASIAGITATFEGEPDPEALWSFADSWFITGCLEKLDYQCAWGQPDGSHPFVFEGVKGAITTQLFPLGGEEGETYSIHFTFNAIAEAHVYEGGERDQGDQIPDDVDTALLDAFHRGGTAIPSSANVWRLRVLDSAKNEVARYYMNSFPDLAALFRRTLRLSYEKDIDVPGKGYIEYMIQDGNWGSVDNCGPGFVEDAACPAPRLLPHEPDVELPSSYALPQNGPPRTPYQILPLSELNTLGPPSQPWRSQLGHLVVTSVTRN